MDLETGEVLRASEGPDGVGGNSLSATSAAAISGDGHSLVYQSYSQNLVAGDESDWEEVFRLARLIPGLPRRRSSRTSVAPSATQTTRVDPPRQLPRGRLRRMAVDGLITVARAGPPELTVNHTEAGRRHFGSRLGATKSYFPSLASMIAARDPALLRIRGADGWANSSRQTSTLGSGVIRPR